jgi:hypothetical protein
MRSARCWARIDAVLGEFDPHGFCDTTPRDPTTLDRARDRPDSVHPASPTEERVMPRGDKSAYTSKQKREAEHIEESYKRKGVSAKTAAARAWATVNKQDGGGKKKAASKKAPAKKKTPAGKAAKKTTARKSAKKATSRTHAAAAKRAARARS